jgi:hypothetical protein
MAVAVSVRFPSLTPEKYDELISGLDLDANPPAGLILHVAAEGEGEMVASELWRTEQTFRAFYDYRLRPALLMHAVEGQPSMEIRELHNIFAAEMATVERMGAVSIPATYAGAAL